MWNSTQRVCKATFLALNPDETGQIWQPLYLLTTSQVCQPRLSQNEPNTPKPSQISRSHVSQVCIPFSPPRSLTIDSHIEYADARDHVNTQHGYTTIHASNL